jgi:hypothetical protein
MGARLENAATKKETVRHCLRGCPGHLRRETVTRVFQRTGSPVEVILERIPASVVSHK